jgi:hypothetical protein
MNTKNMHPPSSAMDEALWAAYHRDDKAAVMDHLFRSLVGTARWRSFPELVISSKKGRAATGTYGEPMVINDGARQIPLRSTLN